MTEDTVTETTCNLSATFGCACSVMQWTKSWAHIHTSKDNMHMRSLQLADHYGFTEHGGIRRSLAVPTANCSWALCPTARYSEVAVDRARISSFPVETNFPRETRIQAFMSHFQVRPAIYVRCCGASAARADDDERPRARMGILRRLF